MDPTKASLMVPLIDSAQQWHKVVIAKGQLLGDRSLVDHLNAVGKWRFMKREPLDRVPPLGSGCHCCTGQIAEVDVRNATFDHFLGATVCEALVPPEWVGKYFPAAPEAP